MLEISGISVSQLGYPPASNSKTEKLGSSERREATTAPADPPPTKELSNKYWKLFEEE